MQTVPEVLKRYGIDDLTEADIAEDLDRDFQRLPGPDATPLTEAEIAYLRAHGGEAAEEALTAWDARTERGRRAGAIARDSNAVTAESLSLDQTADLLGVDRSRISHRLSAQALYAITIGSRRRVPAWQFRAGAELPGLSAIVPSIPVRAHPLDVQALMTTPQDELGGRTPVEHLLSGGAPPQVVELLADLERW
ncbi:MAG TPA: hypothetical protein VFJ12_03345 [Segeticoccus sp.]|jgi:hypothetical protein|nr:hypothetical protein [Segeticoccus sp.]